MWGKKGLLFLLLVFLSCEKFEYSPHQDKGPGIERRDINGHNISRLKKQESGSDIIKIAVIGDTQRFYDETKDFVKTINTYTDLDFIIHTGDITDFGLLKEHQLIQDIFSGLRFPIVTVIGNHDLLGNGGSVFENHYGALNFSFDFKQTRFVFFNSNSREYNFSPAVPDIRWIEDQLKDTSAFKNAVLISHVPFNDPDFGAENEARFSSSFSSERKILLCINGHVHAHTHKTREEGNPLNVLTNTFMKDRMFLIVTIRENSYHFEKIYY